MKQFEIERLVRQTIERHAGIVTMSTAISALQLRVTNLESRVTLLEGHALAMKEVGKKRRHK